jgi:hypothetical protein
VIIDALGRVTGIVHRRRGTGKIVAQPIARPKDSYILALKRLRTDGETCLELGPKSLDIAMAIARPAPVAASLVGSRDVSTDLRSSTSYSADHGV